MNCESMLISCMLMDNSIINHLSIQPYQFNNKLNEIIFNKIKRLYDKHKTCDVFLLHESLNSDGLKVNLSELQDLLMLLPSPNNFRAYEKEIIENWKRFEMHKILSSVHTIDDINEAINSAISSLSALMDSKVNDTISNMHEFVKYMDEPVECFPTGFGKTDYILGGGLPYGELSILGARPGIGKTAFACSVIANKIRSEKSCIFSLEMNYKQIAARILCSTLNINAYSLKRRDKDAVVKVIKNINLLQNVIIDDSCYLSLADLQSKIYNTVKEHGIRFYVIDYLQLMATDKARTKNESIEELTRGMKKIAKEMNVCILCLSQLNRSLTARADQRPVLSDLRDSGAIEQDASVVMFLHREEGSTDAELLIRKNREGEVGAIDLFYDKSTTRFTELEKTVSPSF